MSLRVLLCTHCPPDPQTAVFRSISARANGLRADGHVVNILTPMDLVRSRVPRLDPLYLPLALAAQGLSQYDVVIFHSYIGWAFQLFRRWLDPHRRAVVITSFHGLEPLYHRAVADEYDRQGRGMSLRFRWLHHVVLPWLMKAACRASDAVLCLNSAEARYLTEHRWADADRVYQVSNGVEVDCFVERAPHVSVRRLLFVGQWLPAKGTRYLVDAFTSLNEGRPIELACVGTGVAAEAVLADFPPHLRGRVTVTPRVDRGQLRQELARADVFVFPSLYEGFGRALVEAMAAGLPIVTTPVGAAIDLLQDGRDALLVPCANAKALAEGVRRLVDDADLRAQLGQAAARTAARHTAGATNAKFAKLVQAVSQRHSLVTHARSRVEPMAGQSVEHPPLGPRREMRLDGDSWNAS